MTRPADPRSSPAPSARLDAGTATAAPIVRDDGSGSEYEPEKRACAQMRFPHDDNRGTNAGDTPMVPIIIEGIDPPWLLERAWRTTQPLPDGYRPWIAALGGDDDEWRRAARKCDLAPILDDERVFVFRGEKAVEEFGAFLATRLGTRLNCAAYTLPGRRAAASPSVADVVRAAMTAQQREHARLSAAVETIYRGRDARWWAERFRAAMAREPGAEPLRVLLITSRYTSYVRHATRDLADAFEAAGCVARVLMEPDDSSRLVTVGYLREFESFEPDMVIAANFARPHLGAACAKDVPFVCWIQDALLHLFDSRVGSALGPLDFTFGHTMQALHLHHGWPVKTMRHWPVVASSRRFHAGRVDSARFRRFECDVAYVSHHSPPPERSVQGLLARYPAASPTRRALEVAAPRVVDLVNTADEAFDERQFSARARPIMDEAIRRCAGTSVDRACLWVLLAPLVEREVRRHTLRWAARVAGERGLRLRIYGRGWDADEEFAPFAAGPVEPGEDLRACYQCAAAHLHMSANTAAHQRVYECALSGGLMLRRLCAADLEAYEEEFARRALAGGRGALAADGSATINAAEMPGFEAVNEWRESIGLPPRESLVFDADRVSRLRVRAATSIDLFPDRLLPRSAETLFWSRATLEERIIRAVSDPSWRARTQEAHAGVIAARATADALARDMAGFVRDSLAVAQAPVTRAPQTVC